MIDEAKNPRDPNKEIDWKKVSKNLRKQYNKDLNIYLYHLMNYDLNTIISMKLEDRIRIVQINKQDRELLKQEDFENLTSYETESIKSESAYQIKLEPMIYDAPAEHKPAVIKIEPRVDRLAMNKLFTLMDMDNAFEEHEEILERNVEKQSQADYVKDLNKDIE